jgi:hypothetical protein
VVIAILVIAVLAVAVLVIAVAADNNDATRQQSVSH